MTYVLPTPLRSVLLAYFSQTVDPQNASEPVELTYKCRFGRTEQVRV